MKLNKNSEYILRRRRTLKKLKRKRLKKHYQGSYSFRKKFQSIRIKYEWQVAKNYKSELFDFLVSKKFIVGTEDTSVKISIGHCFNLEENYNETIEKISDIVFSIWNNAGKEIEIDFSHCTNVDQSALFLLQILRLEFQIELSRLNDRLVEISTDIRINFIKSSDKKVNLHLLLCGLINKIDVEDEIVPIDSLGFLKGSKRQKLYLENKKGLNATKIVSYVNQCLQRNSFELTEIGKSDITNLIGEVLNNAEDHSPFSTYYVTANYHHEKDSTLDSGTVGELNLSFMNFGYSIYEGLEENKLLNIEMYNGLDMAYKEVSAKVNFSRDNLFTLYALQDGVSRLKFEDESRGTGTMKFINCFFSLGDYVNEAKNKLPKLTILSGKTHLLCDNKYKPFFKDNKYFVSLNESQSLLDAPTKTHLKDLKYAFPGTLLSIKVFLNKEQISARFANNGSD